MTSSMRHAGVLALVLMAAGLAIFLTKTIRYDYPVTPGVKATIWDFEIFIAFDGQDEPARIEAFVPASGIERTILAEQFYNGPFGLSLETDDATGNRRAIWTYRFPSNRKVLRYTAETTGETNATPLPVRFRNSEPDVSPFEADPVKRQAFIVWSGDIRRQSADNASFAALTLYKLFESGGDDVPEADEIAVLTSDLPGRVRKLELARQTLRGQGIPARIANGVELSEERRRADTISWLEYHIDGEDYRYFPTGEPKQFFTIWYGSEPLIEASGARELETQIAIEAHNIAAEELLQDQPRGFINKYFSFNELPITTRLVYKVLVTIPVGITILVFLRQFVGVNTLGTFMPVLIGIAFRETALLNGLLLFTLLIALGLTARFYLERLQLLLVPRLAVVLIFVVMAMAGITIVMTGANQSIGLSIALFPMVILTMTIERMSIVWEEDSAGEAIKQGAGSLAVAALTYIAMTNSNVEYLMYNFPELLFVLMGLCVLMGRYTGLRLSELWRFRELSKA